MSKKPYVFQEDSPNLVIVPTETCYKPTPKKPKLDSAVSATKVPTQTKNCYNSVFEKKICANSSGASSNKDNLIDVRNVKKAPTSWASNYLQSIGGSSLNFTRLASAPKVSWIRKENTQPESSKDIASMTKNPQQPKTNTSSSHPIIDIKTSLLKKPSININLIHPPNIQKPASQPEKPKENIQLYSVSKTNQPKSYTSTSQAQVNKLPSLPKNYKIPIHSKCNQTMGQPVTVKDITETSNVTESSQLNMNISETPSLLSLPKTKHPPKHILKLAIPDKIQPTNKETIYSLPNYGIKTMQPDTNQDGIRLKSQKSISQLNYDKEVDLFLNKINKVKEIKAPSNNVKNANKSKHDVKTDHQPKIHKDISQLKKNKESKKHGKEIKKRKSIQESDLPKSYRNPCPEKDNNKSTSRKTNEHIARSQCITDTLKVKNKKETTYVTKLKTKKEHIHTKCNKTSRLENNSKLKNTQEMKPKKQHEKMKTNNEMNKIQMPTNKTIKISAPQTTSKKEDFSSLPKKKKKRALERNTREDEYTDSENKQQVGTENSITKKEISNSLDQERSSKSISPIKSVVTKIKSDLNYRTAENFHHKQLDLSYFENSSSNGLDYHSLSTKATMHEDTKIDLRSKLKRKINKKYFYEENCNRDQSNIKNKLATVQNTESFVPQENLIISFDAKNGNETNEEKNMEKTSTVKKLARKQLPGGKKNKKIKLEINIVFDYADTTDEECIKADDEGSNETLENSDCSFLDNFNVDEIVQSLNECKGSSINANNGLKSQGAPFGDSETEEAKVHSQSVLSQLNDKTKTLVGNLISSADGKMINHQAMELKTTGSDNRANHNDVIHNEIIIKEMDTNQSVDIERTGEQFRNEKSQDSETSEKTKIKTELVIPMDISQENLTKEKYVTNNNGVIIQADQKFNTTSNSDNAVMDKHAYKNSESVKMYCTKANYIVEANVIDQIELKRETDITFQNPTKTSTHTGIECDIITIDDSESENEIEVKKTQLISDTKLDLQSPSNKNSVIINTNHTIADNAQSILMDTDCGINGNSKVNTKISSNNENSNREEINLTDCGIHTEVKKLNTDDLMKHNEHVDDNVVEDKNNLCTLSKSESKTTSIHCTKEISDDIRSKCENSLTEVKTETNDEVKSEVEIQHGKREKDDLSHFAKNDQQTSASIAYESAPEKCTLKTVTVNATKAQNKSSPQASSDNNVTKNSGSKPNIKVNNNINSDKFVRKLGCKLLDITGKIYTITELVHLGKFSKIYRCKDPSRWDYAVKVITNTTNGYHLGSQKLHMLLKLQNGVPEQNLNCVRFLKGFPVYKHWCFLMDYYPKNLKEVLAENKRSFHIDTVQILSRQLVSAVTILRNNNIIHSDIKPGHILINAPKTRVKLCGFDQSFYFDGSKMLPNTGTSNYRAPELILGYPAGYGIDVWSTALVMFEMATNQKLFPGIFNNDILYKQLCTLGSIPMEMLMNSTYRHIHFKGTLFTRIVNAAGQRVIVEEIIGNDKINKVLFQTYANDWAKRTDQSGMREDKAKICAFSKLLHSMLAMHPRCRIAIEFVFADPFIYETFDN